MTGLRRPPEPSHTAEQMANRLILSRDSMRAAEAHLEHCKTVYNKAWDDARALEADDWNGMNTVLRKRGFWPVHLSDDLSDRTTETTRESGRAG